jgi:hypothetical protein
MHSIFGMGLPYQSAAPAFVARRAGTTTLYARVDYIPQSGTKNLASAFRRVI